MFNERGFTVVELITVIMIIGILAAVAGPKFIGNDTFVARGVYSTILSGIRLAQKTAIAQRRTVFVNLNTTTRVLCLGYDATCASPVIDPSTQAAYNKSFPNTVTLTASRSDLAFASEGFPTNWNDTVITVQNNVTTEAARTITVWRTTGYAQ